jgi:hypothetical protein
MSNLIQIKRSLSTSSPGSLANGELAYTANGDVLFVGSNGSVVPIAGTRYPGVLTANQALVANSTSGIDKVIVANLTPTGIYANGSLGTAGQALLSNGTGVYWGTGTAGSNTQVQFNDSGVSNGSSNFTYDKTTDLLKVGNSVSAAYILGTNESRNITTNYASESGTVGISANLYVGLTGAGSVLIGQTANNQLFNTTNTTMEVRGGWSANNGGLSLFSGNFAAGNYSKIFLQANTKSVTIEADETLIRNISGTTLTSTNSTAFYVGSNVVLTPSSITVGNSSVNTFINSSSISVGSIVGISPNVVVTLTGDVTGSGNTTLTNLANGTINITTTIAADSVALGTDTTGNYVANVTAGNGLTGSASGEGSTPTLAVVANSGLSTNSSGVFVVAGNGVASNSTGVHVVAGTGVTSNATGVHIGQAVGTTDNVTFNDVIINGNTTVGSSQMDVVTFAASVNSSILPSANVTHSLGNNTLRFLQVFAQNVHSEFGYFDKDVTISGNLVVTGNLVTINVSTLSVTDSLIQLASNNTSSDTLDIGFFGSYQVSGGDHEHTGLFRDATDDTYKLFKGLTVSPTTTVDTSNNTYQIATLQSYLTSGGLVTNATHVAISANATVNVAITANSLSLSSALLGNSGGTGLSSYTAEDILVANSTNGFRKLGLGTSGYVLQSNGTAIVYDTLDGGTF